MNRTRTYVHTLSIPLHSCLHLLTANQEWEVIVAPPPYEHATVLRQPEEPVQDNAIPSQENPLSVEQAVTPDREVRLPSMNQNSLSDSRLSSLLPQRIRIQGLRHTRSRKG